MAISLISDDEDLHENLEAAFSDNVDEAAPEIDGDDSRFSFLSKNTTTSKKGFLGRNKADKTPTPPRKPARKKNLTEPVADGITTLGAVLSFVRPITGLALIDRADTIAESLNDIAKDNDRLYRFLEKMTTGGKWGALATASFPVVCAAYVETGAQGMMTNQAILIMERGLSATTMEKILEAMPDN